MGSEVAIVFMPIGALLFAVLLYRVARGPNRVYPTVALFTSMAAAGYIAHQARGAYVMWFFIWFALVSVPIGVAAHVTRRLVQRGSSAK